MYAPFSSDVTHQKYSGLEERKVKREGEKEANVKSFLNLWGPRWTPAILSPPILHPHTVLVGTVSCHTLASVMLFDPASRLSTVTLRASSLVLWLLTRSCQGRCWVETGDRGRMETDLPSIFPQHLSLCFDCVFVPKAAA